MAQTPTIGQLGYRHALSLPARPTRQQVDSVAMKRKLDCPSCKPPHARPPLLCALHRNANEPRALATICSRAQHPVVALDRGTGTFTRTCQRLRVGTSIVH